MTIDVDVYFNRHKSTFSIRHKGKVIEHTDTVVIKNPRFVVNESGRNRVLREKKKNVHAFVRGEYYTKEDKLNVLDGKKYWKGIYYNPYKHGSFVYLETDQPIAYINSQISQPITFNKIATLFLNGVAYVGS